MHNHNDDDQPLPLENIFIVNPVLKKAEQQKALHWSFQRCFRACFVCWIDCLSDWYCGFWCGANLPPTTSKNRKCFLKSASSLIINYIDSIVWFYIENLADWAHQHPLHWKHSALSSSDQQFLLFIISDDFIHGNFDVIIIVIIIDLIELIIFQYCIIEYLLLV